MNTTTVDLPDADNDGLPDVENETDLDRLLSSIDERTERLLADPKRRYHDLREWAAIMELREYAARWFDEDGNRLPVQPDPDPDVVNLSPPAVHPVEGEDFTFYDGLGGLHVSHQRSNGCVVLANPYLTGVYWRDNAAEVARDEGCSERLIAMAGYYLITISRWCGVPIIPLFSASRRFAPTERFWISDGGTPFNDDEIRMCLYNHDLATMSGPILAGANLAKAPFFQNPRQRPGEVSEDLLPGHAIWTAGQHPDTIIPKLIMRFNTPRFMREAYPWALSLAHEIDAGRASPVPGYVRPEEQGGEHSQRWYDEFEDGDRTKLPRFSSRGLLR